MMCAPLGLAAAWLALSACESTMLSPAIETDAAIDLEDAAIDSPDAGELPDAEVALDATDPEVATEPVYIQTNQRLYSYDPRTNTLVHIGPLHTESGSLATRTVDIAIDPSGHLFGGTENRDIFRIDPRDGFCRYVTTSEVGLVGMTFLSDGRLVAAGSSVATIDLTTGFVMETLVPDNVYETSGDIIALPDGALYWTVREGLQGDGLVRIDPQTGEVRLLGNGSLQEIFGLAYADGVLYGFGFDGVVAVLDKDTGAVVEQNVLDGRWLGATTNPVLW